MDLRYLERDEVASQSPTTAAEEPLREKKFKETQEKRKKSKEVTMPYYLHFVTFWKRFPVGPVWDPPSFIFNC